MASTPSSAAAAQAGGVAAPRTRRRRGWIAWVLLALVAFVALAGLIAGATGVGPADVWALVLGEDVSASARTILLTVRLPRVLAGLLAGAALATSGFIIQTVLDNPLASPNVMGVNSGSGLAVLLASSLLPGAACVVPAAAFVGAVATALLVLGVSARAGSSRLTLVLVGMAASTVLGAGMNLVLIVNPDAYVGASSFIAGGLSTVRMADVALPAACVALGLALALVGSRALNVMSMGEALAAGVGMRVRLCRVALMLVAALLAASAVSLAGLVGFVGLIVPHVVRLVVGTDARLALPCCALAGAAFLCGCDVLARTLFAPYEVPVGILMAFVGGPFFAWLVCRNGRGQVMRHA